MADRAWTTVSFPTPLIFRYRLPLKAVLVVGLDKHTNIRSLDRSKIIKV